MNSDTALSLFVMILAAIGVALLIMLIPAPAGANQICLTKKEARHLWPKEHLYWYSADHCWSNRRGPPRKLKLDPIFDKVRAEQEEPRQKKTPAVKVEAPLRSDHQLKITEDGCCWPKLTEFDLLWSKLMEGLKWIQEKK